MNKNFRFENDTLGTVKVPADKYWGAQTQRSLNNFSVGDDLMPIPLIRSLACIKKAAAIVNHDLGKLPLPLLNATVKACDEIIGGQLDSNFPLVVWQTGSGTQTNMNVNEVIANRANELLSGVVGSKSPVHPNDHVNMGQSSNDCISSAMHMAAIEYLEDLLVPSLKNFHSELFNKEQEYDRFVKVGRTHMMDAVPLTLGQEFSGYRYQVEYGIERVGQSLLRLRSLAQGGTAVGTGINTHPEFGQRMAEKISELTNRSFVTAPNKFEALATHDALVFAHGALKTLAVSIMKIANDIKLMASGPRCGLQELILPENEPGSSIMPGKFNPTQCESLAMICCQVLGNDVAINFGGASGNFELNVFKPLIIHNFLHSVRLLADSVNGFVKFCLKGLQVNEASLAINLEKSLMMATALTPRIGYDRATEIAKKAYHENITLKKAALALGYLTDDEFREWIKPELMLAPRINSEGNHKNY